MLQSIKASNIYCRLITGLGWGLTLFEKGSNNQKNSVKQKNLSMGLSEK